MNGVLVSRSNLLPPPAIVPSTEGVIYRSEVAGNKGTFVLPLYPGIQLGQKYSLLVNTNGSWNWFDQGIIDSISEVVTVNIFDTIFADATAVTAFYAIGEPGEELRSREVSYKIEP